MTIERSPAEQHAEQHIVPGGESDLDTPGVGPHSQKSFNNPALFAVATRVGHLSLIDDRGSATGNGLSVSLSRMQEKLDVLNAAIKKGPQFERVYCGSSRTGIDLGFNRRESELRESDPLPPTENQEIFHVSPWRYRCVHNEAISDRPVAE